MSREIEVHGYRFKRGGDAWASTIEIGGAGTPMERSTVDFCIMHVDDCGESILEQPAPEQLAAVEYFVEHRSDLVCQMLAAVRCFLQRLAEENWFMDEEFEVPVTDEGLTDIMSLDGVAIHVDATDGMAWIGVGGACEWDEEHGLGISIWRDLVLDVGQAEVSFSTPDGGWNICEHLSEPDRQRRDAVLAKLLQDREQREQQSWEHHQASLPDSVKLAQALAAGDSGAAKRLVESGANLNEMPAPYGPAIFMAMEYQDAKIVRAFVDAGARLDVRNDAGQTPLQYAEQVLRMQQMAENARAGLPGALQSMMSQFGMDAKPPVLSDEDLEEVDDAETRDLLRAASDTLQDLFGKLAGGTAAMKEDAPPETAAYYERIEREGSEMRDQWSEIVAVLRAATQAEG